VVLNANISNISAMSWRLVQRVTKLLLHEVNIMSVLCKEEIVSSINLSKISQFLRWISTINMNIFTAHPLDIFLLCTCYLNYTNNLSHFAFIKFYWSTRQTSFPSLSVDSFDFLTLYTTQTHKLIKDTF